MSRCTNITCPYCGRDFELPLDDAVRIAAREQILRKLERLTRQAANELAEARDRQRRRAEAEARCAESLKPVVQAIREEMRKPPQRANASRDVES
jgi:hypothetical protein